MKVSYYTIISKDNKNSTKLIHLVKNKIIYCLSRETMVGFFSNKNSFLLKIIILNFSKTLPHGKKKYD